MEHEHAVRIDKWLWAVRFFRTRSLAAAAVNGGHVQVDGQRVKPSRLLKIGDNVRVRRGDEDYEVEVLALTDRRVGAPLVPGLYRESGESRRRRDEVREARHVAGVALARPAGRPGKRDRRKIVEFLRNE